MRAQEVAIHEISLPETQGHIDLLLESALGFISLAGPQIGISRRIVLVDASANETRCGRGKLEVLINPEIIWSSETVHSDRESCFAGNRHIGGTVSRPESIRLTAYDRRGNPLMHHMNGFIARVVQHAIDHLDGIHFLDRLEKNGCLHWIEIKSYPVRCFHS
jgi:peptide deformylase